MSNSPDDEINDIFEDMEFDDSTSTKIASDLLKLLSQPGYLKEENPKLTTVEERILRSERPIDITESDEVTYLGVRGIYANKSEVINWKGDVNIGEYEINEDSSPEIITKKTLGVIEYIQELAIRYLRPPSPPLPGDIIITQEPNVATKPAPPLIIRQQPARPITPEPLLIREEPPKPPKPVGPKVITISGKRLPPPPRKVVIERLAALPTKPQPVIIERWLPYKEVKRRVIFQKAAQVDPTPVKPKNVIVQWEAPEVRIVKDYKNLGVIRANPAEYVEKYGSTLKSTYALPQFVLDIPAPPDIGELAANHVPNQVHELIGEVEALRHVDLDKEGLSQYKTQLDRVLGVSSNSHLKSVTAELVEKIFDHIDKDGNGVLSYSEAESIFLRINSRLGRSYGEDEVAVFFKDLDKNRDGIIDVKEFHAAFQRFLEQNK